MKVTSKMLQTGANYAAIKGTEYEVAEGICVRLKDPTIALSNEWLPKYIRKAKAQEAFHTGHTGDDGQWLDLAYLFEYNQLLNKDAIDLGKMVTLGTWPEEGALRSNVVRRICQDFLLATTTT